MFKRFRESVKNVASRVKGAIQRVFGKKKSKGKEVAKARATG